MKYYGKLFITFLNLVPSYFTIEPLQNNNNNAINFIYLKWKGIACGCNQSSLWNYSVYETYS